MSAENVSDRRAGPQRSLSQHPSEQLVFRRGVLEPALSRVRDGVIFGPSGPQYTRVSAVLVAFVLPWRVPRARLELYHNPWAARPLAETSLPVTEAVPDHEKSRMRWTEGQSLGHLFGLPEHWPEVSEQD